MKRRFPAFFTRPLLLVHFLFGLAGLTQLRAEQRLLSPQARISIISCGTGSQVYTLFGHTALRVKDPALGIDEVYNYGTFTFDTPLFYVKFAEGRLVYFLSVADFEVFRYSYTVDSRKLSEQVLALNQQELNLLYRLLRENLAVENRYYYYQFFTDNCSTRVFDLLEKAFGERLEIREAAFTSQDTYRSLINPYLKGTGWVKLGMNLGLGWEADKPLTYKERLFLPTELESALDQMWKDGQPLVREKNLLFVPEPQEEPLAAGWNTLTGLWACLALIIGLSFLQFTYGYSLKWIDRLVFGTSAVLGVVLLLLWMLSWHTPTYYNLHILWLLPVPLGVLLNRWMPFPFYDSYLWVNVFLLLSLLCLSFFYHFLVPELLPFFLIILCRTFFLIFRRQKLLEEGSESLIRSA